MTKIIYRKYFFVLFSLALFVYLNEFSIFNKHIGKANSLKVSEINDLFKVFFTSEIFLLDVNILKSIQLKNRTNMSLDAQGQFYSFGIFENKSIDKLNDLLNKSIIKCNYFRMNNIYLKCNAFITIQILIVNNRGNFLWINRDDFDLNRPKQFGDTQRALSTFRLDQFTDENSNRFRIPSNLNRFNFDYDHSRFIECNSSLANRNIQINGTKYQQDQKKNAKILEGVEYISEKLENLMKHYWLDSGSLLGWYRDCGIIPFTRDFDYAMRSEEYDDKIKRAFLGDKKVYLSTIHGMKNDSYEFRMSSGYFTYDLFFMYKVNASHMYSGHQVGRKKYKVLFQDFHELCSAELFSIKQMIPCDPVGYLNQEYGYFNWLSPESKKYSWSNMFYSGVWSDSDWPKAYDTFYSNGTRNELKTLEHINHYSKYKLPKFLVTD